MAYELIDYLLIFWFVLAVVVYILGKILEEQTTSKGPKQKHGRASISETSRYTDDWSPSYSQATRSGQPASSNYSQQTGSGHHSSRDPYNSNDFIRGSSSSNQQAKYFYDDDRPLNQQQHSTSPSYAYTNFDRQQQQQLQSRAGLQSANLGPHYDDLAQQVPQQITQSNYDYQQQQQFISDDHHQPSGAGIYSTIPTATGYNADCVDWVNNVMYLFCTNAHKYDPIIIESVSRSLNEKISNITSSSGDYQDLIIEFTGINRELSTRPELTNLRTELESDRAVSASCKIYNKRISFDLSIQRFNRSSTTRATDYHNSDNINNELVNYELVLENLEGKLKSTAMLNDKLIVIQFLEKPDTKISLKPIKQFNVYQQPQQQTLINEDNLVQIILQTLTQVVVDLYFGDDIDFPQYKHGHQHQSTLSGYKNKLNTILKGSASELKRQIKHDFFGTLSSSSSHDKERKLFIKLVRAKNINYNQNVTCLIELDQPQQQALTTTKSGSNPMWDEHFLFTISEKSAWLVLELWDSLNLPIESSGKRNTVERSSSFKGHNKGANTATAASPLRQYNKAELTANAIFLGLARVSVDELRRNPVQKTSLILQPIGDDLSNSVGGELQVELLFLEHSASAAATTTSDQHHGATHGSSMLRKFNSANSLVNYQHGDLVSIDRKLTPSGYVITTTTITKPNATDSQRHHHHQLQQQQHLAGNKFQQDHLLVAAGNQSPVPSLTATDQSLPEADDLLDGVSTSQLSGSQRHQHQLDGQSQAPSELTSGAGTTGRSSRSRSRSRSLLKAIKKRFSFSRTRSRSVGGESSLHDHDHNHRHQQQSLDQSPGIRSEAPSALSMESRTSRASSVASASFGRAKSVPASRDPSEIPTIVINKNRLSDTASAFTFTHPKSQLVIEVLEPGLRADGAGNKTKGRLCYYAIPEDNSMKRKWSKRGTKLHLFNEHQFVACHLAGSSTCHLCGRVFSRRPGKQGYKCRNCHLLSHKQCHVKVEHNCPYATRDGLKLEYIDVDPPATLLDELNLRTTSSQEEAQQPSTSAASSQRVRPMRMEAKSISMEMEDR